MVGWRGAGCSTSKASVEIKRGVSATINSPAEAELAVRSVVDIGAVGRRDLPPTMASEDFGWYLAERPGAFAWIGNGAGRDRVAHAGL